MKVLNLALEDDEATTGLADPNGKPNELEKADNMVQNAESTDPAEVVKIANYKQEIEELKRQQEAEGDGTSDDTSEDTGDTSTDESGGDESTTDETSTDETEETTDADNGADVEESDTSESTEEEPVEKTEADDEQLNEAVECYGTMTRLRNVIESAKSRNSLSTPAVEMFSISIESIKARLGVTHLSKYKMPAMEDLSGFTARQKHTEAMCVAFEGFVKDVWDAIVRMFKAIATWIGDFFFRTKKSVGGARADLKQMEQSNAILVKNLDKKAELKKKSDDGNSAPVDPVFFENKKGYLLYAPGIGTDQKNGLETSFKLFFETLNEQTVRIGELTKAYSGIANDVWNVASFADADALAKRGYIGDHFKTDGMTKTTDIVGEDLNGFTAYRTPDLPYGLALYIKFIEKGGSSEVTKSNIKQQRYGKISIESGDADMKLPLLDTKEQATAVLGYVKQIQSQREKMLQTIKGINDSVAAATKMITELKGDRAALSDILAEIMVIISSVFSNVSLKGLTIIDNGFDGYSKLLQQYHAATVKEFT